ncbi:hypothetical protein [Craterilacuibacter sp. RT1T]|uniref:hypothetical protein n=1 Tax=Craterilacuibacter sp. RT1T TaxID=2942211 RepID=UPI0020BDB64A|nr:hypothetical protein [Craterilacuibacter sp. RT1T]MCL6264383.1 hypothetical protein [Craterilacuibacter sp. RT1T]
MDMLTFLSKLVEAIAWPVVAVICLFSLKEQLLQLSPLLRRLKYKEFEAEFGEGVREVSEKLTEKEISSTISTSTEEITASENTRNHLIRLAEIAPRAAILEAWLKIEHSAQRLIRSHETAEHRTIRTMGPGINLDLIYKTGVVTNEQLDSFKMLRGLRNKVIHFSEVALPLDEVLEYIDLALSLSRQFDKATKC